MDMYVSKYQSIKNRWLSDWLKVKAARHKLSQSWDDETYERFITQFWNGTESQSNALFREMENLNGIIEQVEKKVH